jgi:hypothetical protein
MKNIRKPLKLAVSLVFLLLLSAFGASTANAAPFEIEGVIKAVRVIELKQPYTFNNKPVISIYIVGHRYGKDFDYQYMVVQDSTQLEGISFSDLKVGQYVRVKSRAEPPGMVGKPIQEIRASRYGCCNYALHIDTVRTPTSFKGYIKSIHSVGADDIVVSVSKRKAGSPVFKYLIVNGKTTFVVGSFSDLKVLARIEIADAGINIPVAEGKDHGKLHGADLFVGSVVSVK